MLKHSLLFKYRNNCCTVSITIWLGYYWLTAIPRKKLNNWCEWVEQKARGRVVASTRSRTAATRSDWAIISRSKQCQMWSCSAHNATDARLRWQNSRVRYYMSCPRRQHAAPDCGVNMNNVRCYRCASSFLRTSAVKTGSSEYLTSYIQYNTIQKHTKTFLVRSLQ